MEISVVDRRGKARGTYTLAASDTVATLKKQFAAKNPKYYVERQWFTYNKAGEDKPVALKNDSATIGSLGLRGGDQLVFKDLGAQVGWRTVFLTEYAGPIGIHLLFYFFPQLFYSQPVKERHTIQTLGLVMVVAHYLKREYESVFVHHFGSPTMPIFNIFKNSFHYWVLGGAFIAYFLYHPLYTAPSNNPVFIYTCVALFTLCELGNLSAHITLRNLRTPGTRERGIPRGGMFELVTCANYTYEVFAWLAFAVLTQTLTAWFFLVVSTAQIAVWALKKHIAMKQEFAASGKLPKRKILFPFIW